MEKFRKADASTETLQRRKKTKGNYTRAEPKPERLKILPGRGPRGRKVLGARDKK